MARVNERSHRFASTFDNNEPCLPSLPIHRTSPNFSRYSFPILLTAKGRRLSWPGWTVDAYMPRRFGQWKTVTRPSTNRARRRVTSLMLATSLLLRQTAITVLVITNITKLGGGAWALACMQM